MRKFTLESGAELTINPAPFADAKNLYQAILKELKGTDVNSKVDVVSLYKEMFCSAFSSKEIEAALKPCLLRCLYERNGIPAKVDDSIFEPVENREDYMTVCVEVARDNVAPFVKTLFAEFAKFSAKIDNIQK